MGQTVFHDLYELSKIISRYLPLGENLPLDQEVGILLQKSGSTKPLYGEHWSVVAKTGDGKTFFNKQLVRTYKRAYPFLNTYICDSKKLGDYTEKDGKIFRSFYPPPVLKGIGQTQIWQPEMDDLESYDMYFTRILQAGKPAIVVIDESKNLKFGTKYPRGYELLLSQGRLPGIFCVTNYQEIANGLRQGLSQARHVVGFSVINPYDERMLKNSLRLPPNEPMPSIPLHSLWYIDRDTMTRATLFSSAQQFSEMFLHKLRRQ